VDRSVIFPVPVSLLGSLSLRCECLHEWSVACVLHTYRFHRHRRARLEVLGDHARDEVLSFSGHRSGRPFNGWGCQACSYKTH